MSDLLVVGSVALDTVETPSGKVEEALGGSATYFSTAASLLTGVRVVAVVGDDFPERYLEVLSARGIDLEGLQRMPGRTFRWSGRYTDDFDQAITLDTQLNVFENFDPELPEAYRDSPYVFLANLHPALQLQVLEQTSPEAFTGADTMNFWIEGERDLLDEVFRKVRCVTINEAEARQYAGSPDLLAAIEVIAALGPEYVVVKKGGSGVMLWHEGEVFVLPAYPVEVVRDPTGAGDTFAGGLFGWLATRGEHTPENLRHGLLMGTILASFDVEDFSLNRLLAITRDEFMNRAGHFEQMLHIKGDR